MKKETIKQLKRKGWSPEDISGAEKIIESRTLKDKSRTSVYSNRVLFWTVIVVIIFGNFIISLMLIPFLLVLNKIAMDVVVVVIGFVFGALFNLLVLDVEQVSKKHHLIAGIAIPVLALINIGVMVKVANAMNDVLRVSTVREDPITISILYVVAFIIPYLWSVFVKKRIEFGYKRKLTEPAGSQKEFLKKY
jgi:hypothetical protein